ncbi:molybdopterin-dependent oxidoreductase [Nocardia brasiliensis]|uniref:Putative sufite oxidase n=1 Tax=Nocardia brasiliensis (strain ATCC 700358 / HUJEG-1) TaxID=1133849 RepID=K0F1D6_NOCB7|nr:molybdopterin-dependent oxidoreductase [Nocardia brasiliensis]AFU03204.1 putative sufite oxidase [Nocardia brasiliensis ATCC 700358]OCF86919.1 oxidoreductase [Nocardia brasiliensis]
MKQSVAQPYPNAVAERPGRGILAAALAGVLAALTVLGVGHLVAAVLDPAASPFYAMGASVVDHTPHALKDAAIRRFGSNDKLALFVSMAAVMLLFAAVAGVLERKRPFGTALLVLLGAIVLGAALERPTATPLFALPTIIGVVAGVLALRLLTRAAKGSHGESVAKPAGADRLPGHDGPSGTTGVPDADAPPARPSRRRFLALAVGVGAVAVGAGVVGQWIGARLRDVVADRAKFVVPRAQAAAAPSLEVAPRVPGLTEFVTPNDRFYRVDTALQLPALTSDEWRLRVHGLVERPREWDFDALRRRNAVQRMITLTCVSNEVGGELAGTAVWTGYPLAELLAEVGVRPEADMLLSRSVDGFTAGTPVSAVLDGRDALLAVGMNGAPLPIAHGYPARLIVPGLYGYVSATKWVIDLELTRFDRAEAYWTERDWAAQAPIKTASRIDVPASFATVPAGEVVVAGVAWAQQRGIDAVEVQVDDQPWQPATLAAEYSLDTWRQWTWRWRAEPGTHTLRVRATDRAGNTQTDHRAPPFPDGSTGWHSRVVTVG